MINQIQSKPLLYGWIEIFNANTMQLRIHWIVFKRSQKWQLFNVNKIESESVVVNFRLHTSTICKTQHMILLYIANKTHYLVHKHAESERVEGIHMASILLHIPQNRREHNCRYALCILNKSFCAQSELWESEWTSKRKHKTLDSHVTYYSKHHVAKPCDCVSHHEPTNRF